MKRAIGSALALAFLFGIAAVAQANPAAPPPNPPPKPPPGFPPAVAQNAKLVIEIDPAVKEPKLVVPISLLMPAPPPPKEKGAALLGLPTIVIGVALSLALASGGFWLVRRGAGRTAAAVILAGALFAAGATAAWADIGVGPRPKPPPPPKLEQVMLPAGVTLSEKIAVEIAPNGDNVRLIVNKDMLIKGEEKKKENE